MPELGCVLQSLRRSHVAQKVAIPELFLTGVTNPSRKPIRTQDRTGRTVVQPIQRAIYDPGKIGALDFRRAGTTAGMVANHFLIQVHTPEEGRENVAALSSRGNTGSQNLRVMCKMARRGGSWPHSNTFLHMLLGDASLSFSTSWPSLVICSRLNTSCSASARAQPLLSDRPRLQSNQEPRSHKKAEQACNERSEHILAYVDSRLTPKHQHDASVAYFDDC